ncbi:hypothetical protein CONPUDRAFT_144745 [Coniophora puteana RWD-64-598 SS2]|uniref:DUF6534 domain-containing protein n=1 Tax=Coniophora puteana (strain RWD-64-598) TaxID=741705 RepID=A0A5M3MKG0_CONPW|nr:uncharacterized protein CONPUDRAFT_144745 [Coniophora puteana RWD-64-598 SS2]EIW79450.1 hypothetical protein CONPUDRAFT_144745 [Coniophora puteana RWD-64-598 SS2]
MVAFLFVLDTVHSASIIYMARYYVVTNYTNPEALLYVSWPYPFTPIATALAALATQIFDGWRIWRLSGNALLFRIIIVLAIVSFGLGAACGIKAWIINYIPNMVSISHLVTSWLVLQVAIDVFITATLITILGRSRTTFRRTTGVVNQIMRGAIQTGLFASVFSLGDLIPFLVAPNTNLYGMFAMPIGRIYTNTLLDTLLTRETLRNQLLADPTSINSVPGYSPAPVYTMSTLRFKYDKTTGHETADESCAQTPEVVKQALSV